MKIFIFFIFFRQFFAQTRIQLFVLTDFFVDLGVSGFYVALKQLLRKVQEPIFTVLIALLASRFDIFTKADYADSDEIASDVNKTVDRIIF